jgi:hypothetical protein
VLVEEAEMGSSCRPLRSRIPIREAPCLIFLISTPYTLSRPLDWFGHWALNQL